MIELSGSVESEALAPVLAFVARLGVSGRLRITRDRLNGRVGLRDGNIVEAACGPEHGLAALELLVLAPGPVKFSFTATPALPAVSSLYLNPIDLGEHLRSLETGRRRLASAVPSLMARPRRASTWGDASDEDKFTLTRMHLRLLFACDGEHSVLEVLGNFPVLPALVALRDLVEDGLVELLPEQPSPVLSPVPQARWELLSMRLRRLRVTRRLIVWVALGVFVGLGGAAQLPDMARQFRGAFPHPESSSAQVDFASNPHVAPLNAAVEWPTQRRGPFWVDPSGYHLAPSGPGAVLVVSPPLWTRSQDVALRARFRKLRGPDDTTYGFVIRDRAGEPRDGTSDHGQFVLVAINNTNEPGVRRHDGDRWIDLSTNSEVVRAGGSESGALLEVVAVGSRISLRVDGAQIANVEDAIPSPGGIAFYASGGGAEIVVDQFTLTLP